MLDIPPLPEVPAVDATPEIKDLFHARCMVIDLALRINAQGMAMQAQHTREVHAKAQADTAVAMMANVQAQALVAAALNAPPSPDVEKRAFVLALLSNQAPSIMNTEANFVASAVRQAELVLAAVPRPGNGSAAG